MKRGLPVLYLLLGLGSSFSIAQHRPTDDPFGRYLAGLKANQPELSLLQFAGACGLDTTKTTVRFAQRPAASWIIVNNLSHALDDQESDFYGTAAVWHSSHLILVERWEMELDTGSYSRIFLCFADRKARSAETVEWSIPIKGASTRGGSAQSVAWGYEQQWDVKPEGTYINVLRRFVDLDGNPMDEPELDPQTRRELDANPEVLFWKDTDLPDALLK